jgi:hypothetical protein
VFGPRWPTVLLRDIFSPARSGGIVVAMSSQVARLHRCGSSRARCGRRCPDGRTRTVRPAVTEAIAWRTRTVRPAVTEAIAWRTRTVRPAVTDAIMCPAADDRI